jgi:hypothetical protein
MKKFVHKDFITYAKENGINLDDTDDYGSWYDCWIHGFCTATEDIRTDKEENKECQQ